MQRILRRIGLVLGGLVLLLLLVAAGAYVVGSQNVGRTYDFQPARLAIPTDSAAIARGSHVAAINGCPDCHGADLGGRVLADDPPFRATAANLTPGGVGARYTDADWERAIRHGVKPDGRAVLIMPAAAYHQLADADLADLVAYLKSLPPVRRDLPPTEVRPFGRLLAAGLLDVGAEVNLDPSPTSAPPAGPTAAYGAYLTSITCSHCHGSDLRGGQPPDPDSPPAPDLIAASAWPYSQFVRALRTGIRPAGPRLDPEVMPWSITAAMTDDELAALYAHLGTLRATNPTRTASNT